MLKPDSPVFSQQWEFAHGGPVANADFRVTPEDFCVDEILGFEPTAEGEHVLLHIRKRGDNTAWVAKQIAQLAGVKPMDVGFCGLKDRHAVTTQWFSIYMGSKPEPDWHQLNSSTVSVLLVSRHRQKLRRGMHAGNCFAIVLRNVAGDKAAVESQLEVILRQGVPNYFGEQRFGREGNNLLLAQKSLVGGERIRDQHLRGLVMSAARSYLFNRVVSRRVSLARWWQEMPGDVIVDGLPTGPLWGRGRTAATAEALDVEQLSLEPLQAWCEALEHVGLSQERRVLVLMPQDLSWIWESDNLKLHFSLGVGAYATTVLRELAVLNDLSHE